MKKLMLVLFAVSSIFSANAIANIDTSNEGSVSLEQIETMKEVVLAKKVVSGNMEMYGCPKGYLLAPKRCWKNWRLVRCGYFCHKPPSPPCCHGEGKPQH